MNRVQRYGLFKLVTNSLFFVIGAYLWYKIRTELDFDGFFENVETDGGNNIAMALIFSLVLFGIAIILMFSIALMAASGVEAIFGLITMVTKRSGFMVPCLLIDLLSGVASLLVLLVTVSEASLSGEYVPVLIMLAVMIYLIVSVILDLWIIEDRKPKEKKTTEE